MTTATDQWPLDNADLTPTPAWSSPTLMSDVEAGTA